MLNEQATSGGILLHLLKLAENIRSVNKDDKASEPCSTSFPKQRAADTGIELYILYNTKKHSW